MMYVPWSRDLLEREAEAKAAAASNSFLYLMSQ